MISLVPELGTPIALEQKVRDSLSMLKLAAKAGRFLWWRVYLAHIRWGLPLADRLSKSWGPAARLMRWPLPWLAPYRRNRLNVSRLGALGDVLMCTPVLRELKRRNPTCLVTFYTDIPVLVDGLPFIDHVRPMLEEPPDAIYLSYEVSIPPRRHIARIMGDLLGLAVRDVRPSCMVRQELVERFQRDWSSLPRPLIVITRVAGAWTPNKDWPGEYWDDLVARLAARATIIDVGIKPVEVPSRPAGSYLDLRGQTTLPELVAAIAAADLIIALDTGPMHIAAAVGTPAVVIYGGYIHPDSTGYPGNINLYSAVECAPCWLREPCPYAKKCLHMIMPAHVEAALNRLWEEHGEARMKRSGESSHQSRKLASIPLGKG
jgi:Glycosyltransferase family 9 (heptosyltransferase)